MSESLDTVNDLIAALKNYDGSNPVRFAHIPSEERERSEELVYDYSFDAVVIDRSDNTVLILSIGDDDDN